MAIAEQKRGEQLSCGGLTRPLGDPPRHGSMTLEPDLTETGASRELSLALLSRSACLNETQSEVLRRKPPAGSVSRTLDGSGDEVGFLKQHRLSVG